jgi:hypothetical protein
LLEAVGRTNSSCAVVRESLAQFHKGNGVCRPGNLASDSAQVAEILVIGVLSVPRLIFRSVKGSLLRGSLLNAQLILLIDADLRDGLGFGDLGHVDGIGGVHRVRGELREEKEEEGESEVLKRKEEGAGKDPGLPRMGRSEALYQPRRHFSPLPLFPPSLRLLELRSNACIRICH